MAFITQGASASIYPSVFTAEECGVIDRAMRLIEEKRQRDALPLWHFEDLQRYLVLRFAGLLCEQGHILYLDFNRRLIAAEAEFFGDQKGVAFDMRQIALRALTLGADSVVFVHNHPSDNPTPSDADLRQLDGAEKALQLLNITLLDSYVVTSRWITSIKDVRQQRYQDEVLRRNAEHDRRREERAQKIRAGRARKAAECAAQLQGAAA